MTARQRACSKINSFAGMTAKQKPFNKSNSFAGMTAKKNLLTQLILLQG